MKTGQCKFGETCKFHHPIPAISLPSRALQCAHIPSPVTPSALYPSLQSPSGPSSQQYGVVLARPSLLSGSYVQGPYHMLVTPGVVPVPGWSPYQVGQLKLHELSIKSKVYQVINIFFFLSKYAPDADTS